MGSSADQAVDELLERYVGLVDQYTTLRDALAAAQQRTFQALARANFTADRGVRFGQDQYDERMQASRRVTITPSATAAPTFTVTEEAAAATPPSSSTSEPLESEGDGEEKASEKKHAAATNPIRWFGVLVPQALRDAQSQSVMVVEDIIPQLVSVEAQMAHLEIEVRRARKRRAKANSGSIKRDANDAPQAVSASS